MDFLTLAAKRFSVRQFKPEHLPQNLIDTILKAAHLAPTGCNAQPYRILVLNTDESIEKLKSCTRSHCNAPTAMLICAHKEEGWKRPYDGARSAPIDACIVTTHMMLAAEDIGVGSTWIMHFNPIAMRETFSIPDALEPIALLILGYPDENAVPNPLHSQYRPLEELVAYENF